MLILADRLLASMTPPATPPAAPAAPTASATRVLLVGLDAACFEQLDPLVADGTVPTIARLIETGASAPLETTAPPWTPSAWPSVVTGTTPFVHGVYDFHRVDAPTDEPTLVSARDVRAPFVWEALSAAGLSSAVLNVPVTHPVHAFDGSLVPGYLAPEGAACLVDGRTVPMATLDPDYSVYARDAADRASRLAEYERLVDARVRAARHLAAVDPEWSFMMVQFQSTDAVFHTDPDPDAVRRVYRRVDAAVADLLDLAGPDATVLVVSDHGIRQYERVVYLNAWLRDTGRLVVAPGAGDRRRVWNEREKGTVAGDGGEAAGHDRSLAGRLAAAGVGLAGRVGVTPARAERLLARVGADEAVGRRLPESILLDVVAAGDHVDYARSAAAVRSLSALGVRCSVAGRDPDGVIPAADFDDVRTALIDDLAALRGPDGERVFEAVVDRHAVAPAPADEPNAPDVLLRPAGMTWKVSDVVRERTFGTTDEYSHTWTGLLIAAGPGVGTLPADATPSVIDVAPTVCALLGVPAPDAVEGRPLFEPGSSTAGPAADGPAVTAVPAPGPRRFLDADGGGPAGNDAAETDADGVVAARLRQMGYLE
jgi:predicted AlkP superfamily phosphohydrolase/phosphomutase